MAKFKTFWTDNAVLGLATLVAGFFNYLYHVVLAHVLGPAGYGDLTTFLSVTSLMAIPASVVILVYTRTGRQEPAGASRLGLWLGGLGLWMSIWLFAAPLSQTFHVSAALLIIFTAEVVPGLALAANVGMLQHGRLYVWVGLLGVLNAGFRVVAAGGSWWGSYRLGAVGILEGAAAWVSWWVSRFLVRRLTVLNAHSQPVMVVATATVGIINVLYALADGLAAKYALPPVAAGLYTGMAVIGHSLQFLSGSVATVMLTAILSDATRRYQYLSMTVAVYLTAAGCGEWILTAHGSGVVSVILGTRFLAIVRWIPYYGWGMICLGLLNIAMLYSVAQSRWEVIATTGGGLVYWIWALAHDHSLGAFAVSTTHIMMVTLIVTAGMMTWAQAVQAHAKVRTDPS